jgi:hypothetical protein
VWAHFAAPAHARWHAEPDFIVDRFDKGLGWQVPTLDLMAILAERMPGRQRGSLWSLDDETEWAEHEGR